MPTAVHVHLQLRIVGDDGTVFTDSEILHLEKSDHRLEAVGLSIGESKTLQRCLQQHVVRIGSRQVEHHIHKALLTFHSEYFCKPLNDLQKKADERAVSLSDVEVDECE